MMTGLETCFHVACIGSLWLLPGSPLPDDNMCRANIPLRFLQRRTITGEV